MITLEKETEDSFCVNKILQCYGLIIWLFNYSQLKKILNMILDHLYFQNRYRLIAIDLGKQQGLDPDPKAT